MTCQPVSSTIVSVEETIAKKQALPLELSWHIQYSEEIDISHDVDVYNLDLFDTSVEIINQLKSQNIFVMCYFSAGTYEDWRPDTKDFPKFLAGNPLEAWPGETWLDIRQIDILIGLMEKRLDLAKSKGCDGVDPDNVNGYENETGFPLSAKDQIKFNIALANSAHQRGLLIGLKNDLNQVEKLVSYFDWALNEECFSFDECELLLPFIEAGKPVFVIEYETPPYLFCQKANELNFNAQHKAWNLGAYYISCR